MRRWLQTTFMGKRPEQHYLLSDKNSDLCRHCQNRQVQPQFFCVACLRAGRRRGACSRQCFMKGWVDHRNSSDHFCGDQYSRKFREMVGNHLTNSNPALHCLNEEERQALWMDVLAHLQQLLEIPNPNRFDALSESTV